MAVFNLPAQSVNLQVVTKEIEKKMKYKEGQVLSVEGEKSEVDIMPWDENYITIALKLSAQHPERAVAKEDLGHFEYNFDNTADTIYIRNSITAKEESLRSGLQAFYTIMVPRSCKVKLHNYFGSAVLTDLKQGVDIKSEFCNLTLKNVEGQVDINTYFGDLIGVMINGIVDIKADRSNVTLSEIEGKFTIDAYMGTVKVFANQSLLDMNINAEKTDVFFYDSKLDGYNFKLASQLGDIEVPDKLHAKMYKENEIRNIVIKPEGELIGAKVFISVVSGDIMLGSR